jgi:hypothetical protein
MDMSDEARPIDTRRKAPLLALFGHHHSQGARLDHLVSRWHAFNEGHESMYLFMCILAIAVWAWVQYRLLPVPAKAPQGLGLIAMCMLGVAIGAFFLLLAYGDMMVGELTSYGGRYSPPGGHLFKRGVEPGGFWYWVSWRFVVGTGFIGTSFAMPFQKRD